MKAKQLLVSGVTALLAVGCIFEKDSEDKSVKITPESHSITPNFLKTASGFSGVKVYPILSSEDTLSETPGFVYGSMADGMGLIKEADGGYTLINNIEADYSIARIKLDASFKPVSGEYILDSMATGGAAMCSGTLATPEEHGFGPLFLSGAEWGDGSKGVFAVNPYKGVDEASTGNLLTSLGQWAVENALPLNKEAYPGKTVILIGDDDSNNDAPSGQVGMYVGDQGDLTGGKLYGLKVVSSGIDYEADMKEGQSYEVEFTELAEREIGALDAEAKSKGLMGFSRVEDLDYRKGTAEGAREIYFAVTGRDKPGHEGKGTKFGRVYKLVLNSDDPTKKGTLVPVLDGDLMDGKGKELHSPDNILVTSNYVYIQEDPNGYAEGGVKEHFARVYQYGIATGELKVVLECDQATAAALGYGSEEDYWEVTGMIDVSDVVGDDDSFLLITQNHKWERASGEPFTDPNANPNIADSRAEGSVLHLVQGLGR